MTASSLPRRTVLAALPAGAILSQLSPMRWALAQDEGAFREQLQASKVIAIELANRVREVPDRVDSEETVVLGEPEDRPTQARYRGRLSSAEANELQALDYQGRRDLANAASGLSQAKLREHVRQEFLEAADTMIEQGVSLIPATRDIVEVSTPSTPASESCPPAGEVMWDILFDTLGLLEEREFFMAALHAVNGTTERVERINESVNEGRWERAVDGFFDLLEFLLDGGTVIVLATILEEKLARRFLRAMAIKLVPFVGTGYATGAFGLAVHRHWDRLLCQR